MKTNTKYLKTAIETPVLSGDENVVMYGGALKAIPAEEGQLALGGYLVVFGDATKTDLAGDWFTPDTYFGAHQGDGVDALFHHSLPVKGLEGFSEHIFAPLKVTKDEIGLFAEWVGNASDKYDRAVYKAGDEGKLGFSSGSAPHMVRYADGGTAGEIKRWPIVEGSFTPTPCEPRARAASIKSLTDEGLQAEMDDVVKSMKLVFDSQEEAERVLFDEVDYQRERAWKLEQINWKRQQLIASQMAVLRDIANLQECAGYIY